MLRTIAIASSLGIAGYGIFGFKQAAIAQIAADSTLSTTVTSLDDLNFVIRGGRTSGPNLFHSFDVFSIPTNGSAQFDNAVDITTIISRVTGGDRSVLDGLLQANGTADLFFLNPNGIVINANAQLDIGGSFIASTADALLFDDGAEFATTAMTPPLLSIASPIGLQMGTNPGPIRVNGSGQQIFTTPVSTFLSLPLIPLTNPATLEVESGQTLALVGGPVTLTGSALRATDGRIELGGVSDGIVSLQPTDPGWELNYDSVEADRNITLQDQTAIDASGTVSQGIQLVGQTLTVEDGSVVGMQIQGDAPSADLSISATAINIIGTDPNSPLNSRVSIELLGDGRAGNIEVEAQTLTIQAGGGIGIGVLGSSTSGNLNVDIADSVVISGTSPFNGAQFSSLGVITYGTGDAGTLNLSTRSLVLTDGGNIGSITALGTGSGGNVIINATESVEVRGETAGISIGGEPFPSTINTSSAGPGNAGNIVINTPYLSLRDAGDILSDTLSTGNAGTVTINASDRIELISTEKFSTIGSDAFDFTSLREQLGLEELSGNGGSIFLKTLLFSATGLSQVILDTAGTGIAGSLTLNADQIRLVDGASISAATASGEGGNLALSGSNLLVLDQNSRISTTANGTGNGGNITLSIPLIVGENNSDIVANAFQGNGGNITINTQGLFGLTFSDRLTPGSDITASSEFGLNGTVEINSPDADPNSRVLELSDRLVDMSQLIRSGCSLDQGKFVLVGQGGLPFSPMDWMGGDRPWLDFRDPFAQDSTFVQGDVFSMAIPTAFPLELEHQDNLIREATEMAIAPNGLVQLISSTSRWETWPHPTCNTRDIQ